MDSSSTAVFRRVVADHMAAPPLVVALAETAAATVARMAAVGASAAVVVDAASTIRGILTEQDVVRRIACREIGGQPVEALMTQPVLHVRHDDHLYQAIGFMRRHRLRHMPVVDGAGALAGMIFLHDALAVAAGPFIDDIERLTHEDSFEGLKAVKAAQVQLAENLFADNVPAPEIQRLISDINNDLYRRVLRLCLAEIEAEGRGRPPAEFACIVMGSGGRGESFLFPDQDNGFVIDAYDDARHDAIDAWFADLAERMCERLDAIGFPWCRGGVMAINPLWRKTLPQWKAQIGLWMRRQSPVMLELCDVFFDFRGVFGRIDMALELEAFMVEACRRNRFFLRQLFGVQADHRAALGLFNRLLTERAAAHRGKINLKHAGTLPLAEAARLMALMHGIRVNGTLERLEALHDLAVLDRDSLDRLEAAFAFVTGLQIRQQIADYRAGRPIGNFIDPADLTERETARLKESFRAINDFRARLRTELTGDIF